MGMGGNHGVQGNEWINGEPGWENHILSQLYYQLCELGQVTVSFIIKEVGRCYYYPKDTRLLTMVWLNGCLTEAEKSLC